MFPPFKGIVAAAPDQDPQKFKKAFAWRAAEANIFLCVNAYFSLIFHNLKASEGRNRFFLNSPKKTSGLNIEKSKKSLYSSHTEQLQEYLCHGWVIAQESDQASEQMSQVMGHFTPDVRGCTIILILLLLNCCVFFLNLSVVT